MNAPSESRQDIFDLRKIRRLVELMKEHDLTEVDLQQGEVRIQLRRAGTGAQTAPVTHAPLAASVGPPAAESDAPGSGTAKGGGVEVIASPMVGTFYAAPDPDAPPFVKIGDHVGPETTVCIIEAMKVFNQIPAELSGRIVAVLVENGAAVEFGQPLFRIDTRE